MNKMNEQTVKGILPFVRNHIITDYNHNDNVDECEKCNTRNSLTDRKVDFCLVKIPPELKPNSKTDYGVGYHCKKCGYFQWYHALWSTLRRFRKLHESDNHTKH
jgi:uncharacterized protein with PIN domain